MIESGSSTKASLVIALQTQDLSLFVSTIKGTSLDLNKFVDPGGCNIFHDFAKAILNENQIIPFLNILLEEFKIKHPPHILTEMLNSMTVNDKQTPLHLAAKHNKLKLSREFLRLGADGLLKDINGQTIFHLASSSGNTSLFVYLYNTLSINPFTKDINSYTPLHLAVIEGHENMSLFLISISKDLDIQDNKGYTPLHLSVFSSSYKIARNLIMRGANRKARCKFGLSPEDLALSRGSVDMVKVLKAPGIVSNPCKTQMKVIGRRRFFINLLAMTIKSISIAGYCYKDYMKWYDYGALSVMFLSWVLLLIVSLKDPGYEKEKVSILELYATIKTDFICPFCAVKKINSTVHCHHCQKCVKKFDHHCPWINNCVGENNHKLFILYVFVLTIDLVLSSTITILAFFNKYYGKNKLIPTETNYKYIDLGISAFCLIILIFVIPILYIQTCNIIYKKKPHQRSHDKSLALNSRTSSETFGIRNSEEWSYSKNNMTLNSTVEFVRYCCWKKKKIPPSLSQTSNINEEPEQY
ncbi:hypothetical protein SteCoe_38800 [Stentor coeruleus]|uniref:Palmitoyltransferase n=1 Tax=Stentor coeruleus TaxID=5963 RepID=A0A1R2ALA3_9CILI|nr:hypothetical protein SteCoe_38800 [Stentor coeruleus]